MTRIAEQHSTRSKLSTLYLYSANFEADETVEKLAVILKSAFHLKECNISKQRGNRKIKVEIEYAISEAMGCIVIKDVATDQVICSKETNKTEAL